MIHPVSIPTSPDNPHSADRLLLLREAMRAINHDARNSLQCIANSLALLEDDLTGDETCMSDVQKIGLATDAIHRLFQQIQSYTDPLSLRTVSVNAESLWREPWAGIKATFPQRQLTLLSPDASRFYLQVDVRQIRLAMREVFAVLLRKSFGSTSIELRAHRMDDDLRISIRNVVKDETELEWDVVAMDGTFDFGFGIANAMRILGAHGGAMQFLDHRKTPGLSRIDLVLPIGQRA